jgi:hypothetical protein
MRRALLLTTGLCWLALTGAAGAVTVTLTQGPEDPQYFAPEAADQNNFTLSGITWTLITGVAHTDKGTTPGEFAAPAGMGTDPATGTTYFGVEGGGAELATWATPQTSLSIYWGSIDGDVNENNLNSVAITVDGFTLTGADLVALGALGTGNETDPRDNQLVTIRGLSPFTNVVFSSTGNAFEFTLGSAIPEPSTWTMLGLGFAGLGYAAFRRNSKKGQAAIGAI